MMVSSTIQVSAEFPFLNQWRLTWVTSGWFAKPANPFEARSVGRFLSHSSMHAPPPQDQTSRTFNSQIKPSSPQNQPTNQKRNHLHPTKKKVSTKMSALDAWTPRFQTRIWQIVCLWSQTIKFSSTYRRLR